MGWVPDSFCPHAGHGVLLFCIRWLMISVNRVERFLESGLDGGAGAESGHAPTYGRHAGRAGVRETVGDLDQWRMRVGDWRIVYRVDDGVLVVLVVTVAPRGGVYR